MKDPRDPRNQDYDDGQDYNYGPPCYDCNGNWPLYQLEMTPDNDLLCPGCRLKCDYCGYYYLTNAVTRIKKPNLQACSDCMHEHELEPLDKVELFRTIGEILMG